MHKPTPVRVQWELISFCLEMMQLRLKNKKQQKNNLSSWWYRRKATASPFPCHVRPQNKPFYIMFNILWPVVGLYAMLCGIVFTSLSDTTDNLEHKSTWVISFSQVRCYSPFFHPSCSNVVRVFLEEGCMFGFAYCWCYAQGRGCRGPRMLRCLKYTVSDSVQH